MLDCKDDESVKDSSLPTDVPTSRAPLDHTITADLAVTR
jgi:hypothetical protein